MAIDAIGSQSAAAGESEEPAWERIGWLALEINALFAIVAVGPAIFRKRRSFFIAVPQPGLPQMGEAPVEENPRFPRCSEEKKEKEKVQEIFKTIAEKGYLELGRSFLNPFNKDGPAWRLIQLGDQIDGIHPFAFLAAAPKEHVRTIFNGGSSFKIGEILKGIRKGMEREGTKLYRYIPDFAAEMGKSPGPIKPLIQARDWIGLVNYLFDTNAAREE